MNLPLTYFSSQSVASDIMIQSVCYVYMLVVGVLRNNFGDGGPCTKFLDHALHCNTNHLLFATDISILRRSIHAVAEMLYELVAIVRASSLGTHLSNDTAS